MPFQTSDLIAALERGSGGRIVTKPIDDGICKQFSKEVIPELARQGLTLDDIEAAARWIVSPTGLPFIVGAAYFATRGKLIDAIAKARAVQVSTRTVTDAAKNRTRAKLDEIDAARQNAEPPPDEARGELERISKL